MALYQIQDKFRNEVRAKSGLMRGREFSMKDLYSFHVDEADLDSYYEKAKKAYYNVFQRCGLKAYIVEASGGAFTDFSHEYQVFTEYGEDEVYFCKECDRHQNKELVEKGEIKCPYCGAEREVKKAIEVGNIFKLMTRFSNPFNVKYVDKNGKEQDVIMGTYGIGPSRVMGAVVEVHHDDSGIVWPEEIAPYKVHLLALGNDDKVKQESDNLYEKLVSAGVEVLYDDRDDSAGIKFSDSDLLGLPYRVVISKKTLAENQVELKKRNEEKSEMVNLDKIIDTLK